MVYDDLLDMSKQRRRVTAKNNHAENHVDSAHSTSVAYGWVLVHAISEEARPHARSERKVGPQWHQRALGVHRHGEPAVATQVPLAEDGVEAEALL